MKLLCFIGIHKWDYAKDSNGWACWKCIHCNKIKRVWGRML